MNDTFGIFLNLVLTESIKVLAPILVAVAIGLAARAWAYVGAQVSVTQRGQLEAAAKTLVWAAEQSGLKDALLNTGEKRKVWVLHYLQKEADRIGISGVNVAGLEALIESTVADELNRMKHLK